MRFAPPRRRAHTSQRATGRLGAFSIPLALAAVVPALLIPSSAAAVDLPAAAGWHGHAIENPQPQRDAVTTPASLPSGWSAGPVRLGTGFQNPDGSQRVREVQERLWKLGYRPGPIDGMFGAHTQAAVQWFQIKHGLETDGIVGPKTLGLLRERTGGEPAAATTKEPLRMRQGAPGTAPLPQRATSPADRSQTPAGGGGGSGLLLLLLLAVPAVLVLVLPSLLRGRRNRAARGTKKAGPQTTAGRLTKPDGPLLPAAKPETAPAAAKPKTTAAVAKPETTAAVAKPESAAAVAPAPVAPAGASAPAPAPVAPAAPRRERRTAIGYVRTRAGDRAELARHAGAIRRACAKHGWQVAELVCDDHRAGTRRAFERPGLAAAMEHLAGSGPSRLVVNKLAHLSRSPAELTALFEWFDQHDVQVIAKDVGFDTTTPQGRRAAKSQLAAYARRKGQARANGHNGPSAKATVDGSAGRTRGTAEA
jgi:peptidoglycan hydrolase-like protein with peptidoglycan-binding domain